jgi:uncharacterized sporulation protein YeaH/YhbH (DUF444 family)
MSNRVTPVPEGRSGLILLPETAGSEHTMILEVDVAVMIAPPGSGVYDQRGRDVDRFFERLQKKIDPTQMVLSPVSNIFGNQDKIKLQVAGINEWRFVFGRDQKGDGGGGQGSGQGTGGEQSVEVSISEEEYDRRLFQGLELPNMLKKRGGETEIVGYRLRGLANQGSRAELSIKDTFKNRYKRAIALAKQNPELLIGSLNNVPTLKAVPIAKMDKRYWQFDAVLEPKSEAVVFLVCDNSGSMTKERRELAYKYFHLKYRFLNRVYNKRVHVVMIAHGMQIVVECETEQQFRNASVDGGTAFRPAMNKVLEIAQERYPTTRFNLYMDHATDGDVWGESEAEIRAAYTQLLDNGFNFLTYLETLDSPGGGFDKGGRALKGLDPFYAKDVGLARVHNDASIFAAFQSLLKKDAVRS